MELKGVLTAIAVMASLVAVAEGGLEEYHFPIGDHNSVKVDGSETVRWPTDFDDLPICTIPIKLDVGMYVEVGWPTIPVEEEEYEIEPDPNDVEANKDKNRKIVLEQVLCNEIGKDDSDWPCYLDCIDFKVRANFRVILAAELHKTGGIIKEWEAYFDGTNIISGSGEFEKVRVCVKAWKANLSGAQAGENEVGKLIITVVPDMTAPIFIFEQ